jgi:hypothetical protein
MHTLHEGTAPGEADWERILMYALPYVDRFCPSLDEALYIYDGDYYGQLKKEMADTGRDITDSTFAVFNI